MIVVMTAMVIVMKSSILSFLSIPLDPSGDIFLLALQNTSSGPQPFVVRVNITGNSTTALNQVDTQGISLSFIVILQSIHISSSSLSLLNHFVRYPYLIRPILSAIGLLGYDPIYLTSMVTTPTSLSVYGEVSVKWPLKTAWKRMYYYPGPPPQVGLLLISYFHILYHPSFQLIVFCIIFLISFPPFFGIYSFVPTTVMATKEIAWMICFVDVILGGWPMIVIFAIAMVFATLRYIRDLSIDQPTT